jgi:FtsH-binding integral membrane protein
MNIENNYSTLETKVLSDDKTLSKKFMANVFMWMFAGLLITAVVAWLFVRSSLIPMLIGETGLSMLGWLLCYRLSEWCCLCRLDSKRCLFSFDVAVYRIFGFEWEQV